MSWGNKGSFEYTPGRCGLLQPIPTRPQGTSTASAMRALNTVKRSLTNTLRLPTMDVSQRSTPESASKAPSHSVTSSSGSPRRCHHRGQGGGLGAPARPEPVLQTHRCQKGSGPRLLTDVPSLGPFISLLCLFLGLCFL